LGVKVGRKVEASTVLPLPTLTKVDDGAFLADDTLTAPAQLRAGWIRLGESVIGERAFVGNSAIVGPDRTLPKNSLVAVLSDVPAQARINSSWLGRPALEMPRQPQKVDLARTFNPPPRLVLARTLVEFFRILPMILSALLGQVMLAILDEVDLKVGLAIAASVSGVLVLGMGIIACLITTMAKWLLVGRFRASEHPLWSSFVWRNELFDNFVEVLAVPWLAGSMMGTPALNWWFRTLGAKIGRGVWCDTYWLPEPDLIEIGTGSSVNRGVVLQTHLFHDRLMRLDRVCLASGATLGPHSVILPGATIESLSTVGPASLVMRGEKIPAASQWLGNPVSAWSVSRS
jgi:non-ribosomal peptide synthetase-like protein